MIFSDFFIILKPPGIPFKSNWIQAGFWFGVGAPKFIGARWGTPVPAVHAVPVGTNEDV